MSSAMHAGSTGADPFAKVKGLIQGMIERLESEAGADATQAAHCAKETAESTQKSDETKAAIKKLSTKLDQQSARSAQLKRQVTELSKSLTELAASRAEMGKMRQEERAAFGTNRADLEQGIEGIKMALKVLREYYAKKEDTSAQGAGTGIIGLLEVCESDFTKGLAEATATEEEAARTYDQEEKDSEIERVTKEKDVEYKNKEAAKLDKAVSEAKTDRAGKQSELDAVTEYLTQLSSVCQGGAGTGPETYAARKAHREAEIDGLQEALRILESETASFIQKHEQRALRGHRNVRSHVA
jgi:hypothetical protein